MQQRKIDIKWQGANIFISELLRHESVGLRQMEADLFEVYFGATLLGESMAIGRTLKKGACSQGAHGNGDSGHWEIATRDW